MVGRELQNLRPFGEDHQGLARVGGMVLGPRADAIVLILIKIDDLKRS